MALSDLSVSSDAVLSLEIRIKDEQISRLTRELAVAQAINQVLEARVEAAEGALASQGEAKDAGVPGE